MNELVFEWDPDKAQSNELKHGISFNEATTIFMDEFGLLIDDPGHFNGEKRFLLLGLSCNLRLLVVSHCYRSADSAIRIISARKATRKERDDYGRRHIQ